jgi:Protein of unknown function (DUF2934)
MLEKTKAKTSEASPKTAKASKPKASGTAAGKPATARPKEDVHDRIQRRAYELWESEGRPEGREHSHWLQAEHEVAKRRGQRASARG